MTPRPLLAIFVTGTFVSASIGSAHAQEAAAGPPPAAEAAVPAPTQSPPPNYPQYPAGAPYQQYPGPPPTYGPQAPVAWPRYIKDWDEGQPVPYGYHPETRARKGLVIPGAVVFGVAYLLSTLVASADNSSYDGGDRYNALWIPVVGPFIQLGRSNNPSGNNDSLVFDGLAQTAGLTMLVLGLAYPRRILVRNDLGSLSFAPTPMKVGSDGTGLGLVGRF
jgi:hypothetical protein